MFCYLCTVPVCAVLAPRTVNNSLLSRVMFTHLRTCLRQLQGRPVTEKINAGRTLGSSHSVLLMFEKVWTYDNVRKLQML